MDSHKPKTDAERERLRQQVLAKRLGEAFAQLESTGANAGASTEGGAGESVSAEQCPDAELLAAYQENALAPEQAERWEGHFGSCSRCRKILAILAASSDVPLAETEVARLGTLAGAGTRGPTATHARALPWKRWLAPLAGVAAVLVVWFAMRAPWQPVEPSSAEVMIAQAPPPQADARGADFGATAPQRAGEAPLAAPGSAQNKTQDRGEPKPEGSGAPIAPQQGVGGAAASAQLPQPAAPPPATARAEAFGQGTAQVQAQAESVADSEASRANRTRASQDKERPEASVREQAALMTAAPGSDGVVLASPSGGVSFRGGSAGRIERSTDAGRTWVTQASPVQQDWLAGAVVSERVAWLAGRNGAIARTTDGERWERVAPPSTAVLVDWVAIEARDARSATITAGDGRRYATTNAGQSWLPQ